SLAPRALRGRALVPGCGRGHEVTLAAEHGLDATGLDIAPTGTAEARSTYPRLAERFVTGSVFDPPAELRGAYAIVLEHTCLCALPPALRADYRRHRSHAAA
ncbi:MAG: methyltransferase domain-containing protein, partial [Nitrospira sp.]